MTTIRVVLPAYNEAKSLKMLIPALTSNLSEGWMKYKIYVIDDSSSDNTAQVVRLFVSDEVTLMRHSQNQGLAETINTGLRKALKESHEEDIIVTMDADSTHLPGLIIRMVRLIKEGHDVVISSRFVSGARVYGVPWKRRILSQIASLIFSTLFPITGVRDYTCGYRAYRAGILKQALKKYGKGFIDERGFSCPVDILLKLRALNPIITEVPLILRYDLKPGKSKMNVGSTISDSLKLILKHLRASTPVTSSLAN